MHSARALLLNYPWRTWSLEGYQIGASYRAVMFETFVGCCPQFAWWQRAPYQVSELYSSRLLATSFSQFSRRSKHREKEAFARHRWVNQDLRRSRGAYFWELLMPFAWFRLQAALEVGSISLASKSHSRVQRQAIHLLKPSFEPSFSQSSFSLYWYWFPNEPRVLLASAQAAWHWPPFGSSTRFY